MKKIAFLLLSLSLALLWSRCSETQSRELELNDLDYFEARGVNVFVYSNLYNPTFFDEKIGGIELIHHGVRTATGGAVRLHNTPEQWDLVPSIESRNVDRENNTISVVMRYDDFDFNSEMRVTPSGEGFLIQVYLDKPVPEKLEGRAGLNFEFLPPAYWDKNYLADGKATLFPRYPTGDTYMRPLSEKIQQIYDHITFDDRGLGEFPEPLPITVAKNYVFAPDDPERRVTISSDSEIMFFDGRILAQNGWYVVRSLLPAGQTGKVMEWYVEANAIPDWTREPNIGFSQVGYTPDQEKVAVIELDKHDKVVKTAALYQVSEDGKPVKKFSGAVNEWGPFLRYNYATFDFSSVKDPGVYYIEYGDHKTNAFPISGDVHEGIWHASMDIWFPVQMDHMTVNEGYRTWHGIPYKDDALQAPTNHRHFDGYSMGESTYTRFKPFDRIPGLDVGGWFDAGDFDIQTGSHNGVVSEFVRIWEAFGNQRDMTFIDQKTRYVDIHRPDGKIDMLQQIEHGALALVAQVENIGFAVRNGIIVGNLHQYHHLGDAGTITDNLPYNPNLKPYESNGLSSGTLDDRWVFTNRSAGTDYSTAASLAGASRALKDYNPDLSRRALAAALKMWNDNANTPPADDGRGGGYGGGNMAAALQLYLATKEERFKTIYLDALWTSLRNASANARPGQIALQGGLSSALTAYPHMDQDFRDKLKPYVEQYKQSSDEVTGENPYGVPVGLGTWGGSSQVASWGVTNFLLNKYYPDIVGKEPVYRAINYLLGCHPYSNLSFVATVGAKSKRVVYGNNRADFAFIPGALVPGLVLLKPDFLENKDDWPFLWGENETTITGVAGYIFFAQAVEELSRQAR